MYDRQFTPAARSALCLAQAAAAELGISERTLYRKIKQIK